MKKVYVTDFGAVGNGRTMNTEAFAKALAELRENGGGELVVPAGEYLCGSIELIDNLTLNLEKGAVLKASPDIADHKTVEKHFGGWLDHYFIYGQKLKGVKIIGEGEINGNGDCFWEKVYFCGTPFGKLPQNLPVISYNVLKPKKQRPVVLYLEDCQDIEFKDITIRNASCYTLWTVSCKDVLIDHVTIRNLRYGPNTDALDIDCTQNVLIKNCDIIAGDDCIAVKSDPNRFGRMDACENVRVEDCRLSSSTCAVRIGYEGDAPIRNLAFRRINIYDTRHGIDILSITPVCRLKIDHGTPMDDFIFENISMENVGQAFFIWSGNEPSRDCYDGHIRNLIFKDMQIRAIASSFIGSEKPGKISGIVMENITMHVTDDLPEIKPTTDFSKMPSHWGDWLKCGGLHLHNSPGIALKNCTITCDQSGFAPVERSESPQQQEI